MELFKPTGPASLREIFVFYNSWKKVAIPGDPAVPRVNSVGKGEFSVAVWMQTERKRSAERNWPLGLPIRTFPLVWRSMFNPYLQYHFGLGFVATAKRLRSNGRQNQHIRTARLVGRSSFAMRQSNEDVRTA